ncbi:MAG TPA: BON domain-containing protein [bacterium]|nr:BON domain-containing protein [bacterium]
MKIIILIYAVAVSLLLGETAAAENGDAALTERVRDALRADPHINNLFMEAAASGGTVTLSGRAVSAEDKERAGTAAGAVSGVRAVRNELEVKPLSPDDADALKAMQQRVLSRQQFSPRTVLPATRQPQAAQERQRQFEKGISRMGQALDKNIRDNYSDQDIKLRVEEAIHRTPSLSRSDNITVLVQNGRVALYGTVGNHIDQQSFRDAARNVPGVVSVDDNTQLTR